MKKLVILFLCFGLCFSFSACGGVNSVSSDAAAAPTPSLFLHEIPLSSPELPDIVQNSPTQCDIESFRLTVAVEKELEQHPQTLQQKTSFSFTTPSLPSNFSPWNLSAIFRNNVYEGLLYAHMNSAEDIRGAIAESWYCSEDGLNWYFKIRNNVKYSDSTACNAETISEYLEYWASERGEYSDSYGITSWSSLSGNKLQITLEQPVQNFELILCKELYIGSASALKQYGPKSFKSAVATGPYILSSFDENSGAVLTANPHYYLSEKYPAIETVNLICSDNYQSIIQSKTADCVYPCSGSESGYNSYVYHISAETVWLNSIAVPEFGIKEVRMAMCRFVDFDAINTEVFKDLGTVQNGIWAEGDLGYVKADNFYCSTDEGLALLAEAGISPADIEFDFSYALSNYNCLYELEKQLNSVGVNATFTVPDATRWEPFIPSNIPLIGALSTLECSTPAASFDRNYGYNSWSFPANSVDQVKFYGEELYEKIYTEYETLKTLSDWDEQLASLRKITSYIQDEYICIGGITPPRYLLINPEFKNPVLFDGAIQLYYIYK